MTIPRPARVSALRAIFLALATLATLTMTSFDAIASAQTQESFRLVPVSPGTQSVVLGDRLTLEVRVLDAVRSTKAHVVRRHHDVA